ncbi:beta-lactoglobulin isoform X2 [Tamandua tetradactyla]|uniref:beta-lactoglobulin isoform X2 n=1 Tax=Tamandua tetradactyla TaxID=48850 RepID=UPI004053B8FE
MILLLALALGLVRAQRTLEEVPLQRDFDAQKVAGRWLTIGLSTSNADLFSPDDPVHLSLHSIWPRDTGEVDFTLFWVGEGLCEGLNFTVQPTALQGQYQGSLPGGGSALVRVVGTDYSSLILYARVEEGAAVRSLWALLARRMFQDPQWLGRYLGYVRKFHLKKAPVFNVDGRCHPPQAQAAP